MPQHGSSLIQGNYVPPVKRRIEDWKSRLIDMSRRNNLLYFRHIKRGTLSVSSPNMEKIFNRLVLRKRKLEIFLPPEETENHRQNLSPACEKSHNRAANQLVCDVSSRTDFERTLRNLYRRSLSDFRERGVRVLHAAFGMLVWKEKDTLEEVRSPLILVPIELARETFREPFSISVPPVEEETVLNPALQVKLKNDFEIELPPLPEYWDYQSLNTYFNDIIQIANELGWKVETTVEIGLFSFHKLVIYNDLGTNEAIIKQHPIIRAIAGINDVQLTQSSLPDEKDVDKIRSPEKTFQVLDADSSQRVSIEYALRGQSFVMQGPPGTGKSQTIANIIAECITQGKSVLFVSDKMAALEVVYKRLREVGLSSFCLELHSSKANKREVVAELKRCLDEQLVPRKLPSPHEFEKMASLRDSLNNYVVALHKIHPTMQQSAYEVLGQLASLECVPYIALEMPNPGGLTPQKMRVLEDLMYRVKNVWRVVDDPDFPWREYRVNSYNLEVRSELSTFLVKLQSILDALGAETSTFANQLGLNTPSTFDQVKWLIEIGNFLLESPKPEASWVTHPNLDKLISEAEAYRSTSEWCKTTRSRILEHYNIALFSLAPTRSTEFEEALTALNKLLLLTNIEESMILEKRGALSSFVKDTQILSEKWNEKSQQLAPLLDVSTENITPERVRQLFRIALLCFSEEKPEQRWLDTSYFLQVKEAFPKMKKDYEEHRGLKLKLEETYKDEIFDVDLDEYIRRYNDLYKSSLRWFRPGFYHDQKQISLLTHDGKVPKSVLQDLVDARRLKTLSDRIDASAKRVHEMLGHFYQGYETDFQQAEKAIEITSELFIISGAGGIADKTAQLVSYGSNPSLIIKQIGNELQVSFEKWHKLTEELSPLLPISRLSTSSLPTYETPLRMLQDWASSVEKQLTALCEITAETLKTSKGEEPQTYKQLIADLKDSEQVRKKEAAILDERALLQKKFGFRFSGLETSWEEILSVLKWTMKLQTLFESSQIPEAFGEIVSLGVAHAPSNTELIRHYDTALKSLAALESRFETELTYKGQELQKMNIEAMQNRLKWLREHVDDLQVWVDFKETKRLFSLRGLSAFFERLVRNPPPSSQLADIFRKAAYQEWINHLYAEDPQLGEFRREKHEQLIADFSKLDQELIRLSANRVIEAVNSRKPQDILIQANDSEVTTLLKEAVKKRQLMPIRTLLQRIPHLLSRLKPCLLMSPMSVSQFLPAELMKFDMILFDEASQIVPEDAISTIYRGKTIVIAGDNKQLPPTSFFQKSLLEDIDWDEVSDETVEVFDSILDEAVGIGLPVKTLRWHYRSKHEELIAFSNSHFYDGTLITFPSAIAKNEALGVKLVYVQDGVYDRGGQRNNLKEAEVVADLVFDHFERYPKKTLGVVTFSIAQMDAVEDAVDRRRRQHPECEHFFKEDRLEGFFIKNLENVQGDERDVVIICLGYGYDFEGKMTMNFGPVNRAGGERRLNVAVTRAREKTILVSSIKSSDIDLETATSEGTVILHDYLEYAEKGPEALKLAQLKPGEFESPIAEDVAMVIQRFGYAVVPRVGCNVCPIDMGVVDPHDSGNYLLGIEFDGATYQNISSARDRNRLREQVLKQLGWRVHRIWSPTWVARRDSEIRRLATVVEESHRFQLRKEAPKSNDDLEEEHAKDDDDDNSLREVDVQTVHFAGLEKIGVPYRVHSLQADFSPTVKVPSAQHGWVVKPNEFHFQENRPLQTRLLEELVNEEGPVHFEYAVRRLASLWGLKRKGPKIVQAVREALNLLLIDQKVVVKGSFLWPPGLQEVQARVPVAGVPESKRKLGHIPSEEIENAMELVAQYALSISAESLIGETAKVFGFRHAGEKSRKKFYDIYKRLLWEKRLVCANDMVTVA
jgi:hypothetical protein